MTAGHTSATPACSHMCRPPRHYHPSPDLDATGLPCSCGRCRWVLCYGGPLPVTMSCAACGQGMGLEKALRARRRWLGGE